MEPRHTSASFQKCEQIRDSIRKESINAVLREQAQGCRKRFDEEEQANFTAINSKLSKRNVLENVLALHRFSNEEKFCLRMLCHSQLITEALMEFINDHTVAKLLVEVLVNLSAYEEFEMPEDNEVASLLFGLLTLYPKQTLVLLSNIAGNKTRYAYSELFSKLISSGICDLLKGAAADADALKVSVRFLCGMAQTRQLIPLNLMAVVFHTICSFPVSSLAEESLFEISYMLGEWTKLTEINELASLLVRYFLEFSLKVYEDFTFEILQFYSYVSRHPSQMLEIASRIQGKLQASALSSRYSEQALLILLRICHLKHASLAEFFGEKYVETLLSKFQSSEESCQAVMLEALELVVMDKHNYSLYYSQEFVQIITCLLHSLLPADNIKALQLLRKLADNSDSVEQTNRMIHPYLLQLNRLASSPQSNHSSIHDICNELLFYEEPEL